MNFFFVVILFALVSLSNAGGGNEEPSFSVASSSVPSKFVKMEKSDCDCRLRSSKKIIGGSIAEAHLIPWQVSLAWSNNDVHFCGGTIINPYYVLTAAHCVNDEAEENIIVRVGIHNIFDPVPVDQAYSVKKIIAHPYPKIDGPGDFALLELKKDIKFIKYEVEPACLNFIEKEYTSDLMASGWGATTEIKKDPITEELIIDLSDLSPVLKITYQDSCEGSNESLICTNSIKGDLVSIGDSGGPLHLTENGLTSIEGVYTFSKNKSNEHFYTPPGTESYFSRLSFYKVWVEDIIGDNYCTVLDKSENS